MQAEFANIDVVEPTQLLALVRETPLVLSCNDTGAISISTHHEMGNNEYIWERIEYAEIGTDRNWDYLVFWLTYNLLVIHEQHNTCLKRNWKLGIKADETNYNLYYVMPKEEDWEAPLLPN